MADRIKIVYDAIDQMAEVHGSPRPEQFGGGIWNFDEEIELWKKEVKEKDIARGREPLTPLQWKIIDNYIDLKRQGLKNDGNNL